MYKDTRKNPYHSDDGKGSGTDKFIMDLMLALILIIALFFCCYMYVMF